MIMKENKALVEPSDKNNYNSQISITQQLLKLSDRYKQGLINLQEFTSKKNILFSHLK